MSELHKVYATTLLTASITVVLAPTAEFLLPVAVNTSGIAIVLF